MATQRARGNGRPPRPGRLPIIVFVTVVALIGIGIGIMYAVG
jgi:hypothetical protein